MNTLKSSIYHSYFNQQSTESTTTIIIVSIILIVQFSITILFLLKGFKKYKQYSFKKQSQLNNSDNKYSEQNFKKVNEKQNQNFLYEFIFNTHNKFFLVFLFLLLFIVIITCITMLFLSFLAVFQAVEYNYKESQNILQQKIESLQYGNDKWIGLQNIVPNLTELNLVLNTRLQVSINSIRGLLLNGSLLTQAQRQFAIGFPNNTQVRIVNNESVLSNSIINPISNSTNVQTFINAKLKMWLFRNTSYSSTTKFPICQPNLNFPIQHPIISSQPIQLNYMDNICSKLTKQANDLIQNGKKVDQLLVQLQNVQSMKSTIQTNLSTLNLVYSPISIRSNQYKLELNSINIQNVGSFMQWLVLLGFGSYVLVSFMSLFVIFIIYWKYFCKFCKFQCHCQCDCDCDDEQQNYSEYNNQKKNKHKSTIKKFKQSSVNYSRFFLVILVIINILIGISCYYFSMASLSSKQFCQKFKDSKKSVQVLQNSGLLDTQIYLLRPLQKCASGESTFFMQNTALKTAQNSLQKLYNISNTFNLSVPKNVYNTDSLNLIQDLKYYLFHLQKMPIKSTTFDLIGALNELNQYSNGSHPQSKQVQQCSSSVIQDQYVYNSIDCKHKLLNFSTQQSTIQPRCIILPTYNGTPGSVTTKLNSAQHTFTLNSSCPSIQQMFNPLNTNCFLNRRLNLLQTSNCINTATQLGKRLQNLVKFSIDATSYTDIYMQNVRNFFGAYATLSTNLTEFFNGRNNMPQILIEFGTLSENLLKKTKCDKIKNDVEEVYNSYCPNQNNISMLFYDASKWTLIAFILISIQTIIFYFVDLIFRVNRINKWSEQAKQQNKITNNKIIQIQRKNSQRTIRNNQIQLSHETLIRDQINNEFDYHDGVYLNQQNSLQTHHQYIEPYFDSAKKLNIEMQQTGFDKNKSLDNFEKDKKIKLQNQRQGSSQINSNNLLKIDLDDDQEEKNEQKNNNNLFFNNYVVQQNQLKRSITNKYIKKRLNYKISDQYNNNYLYPNLPEPHQIADFFQQNIINNQQALSSSCSHKTNKTAKKPINYLSIDIKDDLKLPPQIQKLKFNENNIQSQQRKQSKTSR